MFRLRLATSALASVSFARTLKSTDSSYEDDRWLEAEFQDPQKTVEERYAHEKQRDLMKKLIGKMREEHDNKIKAVHEEQQKLREVEVGKLNAQLKAIQDQLNAIKK